MKTSIRFYNNREVRAIWEEEKNRWFFSVLDIVGAINAQDDYKKNRNYWKYLKAKLKKENSQVVSATTRLLSVNDKYAPLNLDLADNDELTDKLMNAMIKFYSIN